MRNILSSKFVAQESDVAQRFDERTARNGWLARNGSPMGASDVTEKRTPLWPFSFSFSTTAHRDIVSCTPSVNLDNPLVPLLYGRLTQSITCLYLIYGIAQNFIDGIHRRYSSRPHVRFTTNLRIIPSIIRLSSPSLATHMYISLIFHLTTPWTVYIQLPVSLFVPRSRYDARSVYLDF